MTNTRHRIARSRPRRARRAICGALVCAQFSLGIPPELVAAQRPSPATIGPKEPIEGAPAPQPAPRVTVNRTTPRVTPPPLMPTFSRQPTDREITDARIFGEPLTLVGRGTLPGENRALTDVVEQYLTAGNAEAVLPFWAFLKQYPDSPWQASLLLNLGIVYRRTGHFSRAVEAWEQVWTLGKAHPDPRAKPIADRAVGELLELNARLGRFDRLETLLAEVDARPILGRASEQITGAREGLSLMRTRPDQAFRCGPMAIDQILLATRADYRRDDRIWLSKSTSRGTSLAQMKQLASDFDLRMQPALRSSGAPVLLPALVHWRAGHFAALIREENGKYLVRDPTFGDEIWVSRNALDDEGTGYMLVPKQELPRGWRAVGDEEAGTVWGKGNTNGNDPAETCTIGCCKTTGDCSSGLCVKGSGGAGGGGNGGGPGGGPGGPAGPGSNSGGGPKSPQPRAMPIYRAHLMLVSLSLQDIPVGYTPPLGPDVQFTVTYNQREAYQPQTFSFSHLGPKWMANWVSYVEDDPATPSAMAYVALRGGGREGFQNFDAGTQQYAPGRKTQTVLARTSSSPIRYERRLSDGSIEVFAQADGSLTTPRRVFMTEVRDPAGNAVSLSYDTQLRLVALTDAIGQVTTIDYTDPADSRRITRVTDPFGRYATFAYDGSGRLNQITDVIGMTSSFTYDAGDFITALTTPYGTSRFSKGENGKDRWLEMADPAGGRERVEYRSQTPTQATSDPGTTVPNVPGAMFTNSYLEYRNTFYWDKRGMAVAPRDPASAHLIHWLHTSDSLNNTSGVMESERPPLEGRIWYLYPGQANSVTEGTDRKPSVMAIVLDDGTSQAWRSTSNAFGNITSRTDPLGRTTNYVYAANGIDLLEVRQVVGATTVLVSSRTYDAMHRPLTFTDASGQTLVMTYNANGQLETSTMPERSGITENRTTTFTYLPDGYLASATGPVAGATVSLTYDDYGRIRTQTVPGGHTLTFDYDALDRETRVTFPDGTYDEVTFDRLDVATWRDRLGQVMRAFYDAAGRLVSTQDPLGRTETFQWCDCGSLDSMRDGEGNVTSFERDLRGRVIKETRAGGFTQFVYENRTNRLKQRLDRKGQTASYEYFLDNRLKQVSYVNAQYPTSPVSYTYDASFGRLATMTDATGTTTWTYSPIGSSPTLGAGRVASISGPVASSTYTIAYAYDEHGRGISRALNGNVLTLGYDAMGRIATQTTPLGTATFTYVGGTGRINDVAYPNGQTTQFSYFNHLGDDRLQTITHRDPTSAVLSQFTLTYDKIGSVQTWDQQLGATSRAYAFEHDAARQLVRGVLTSSLPAPIPTRFAYAYDGAGNRSTEQRDDAATRSVFAANRLVSTQAGGAVTFRGTLSEPATLTIAAVPAEVAPDNSFAGQASLPSGTSTVAINATDASGNTRTNLYEVDQLATGKTLSYDNNGNLVSDGTSTFEWDAENRLIAVEQGSHRSEFAYDGFGRRVRIVEKTGGVVMADRPFVWCGLQLCEERNAAGSMTIKALFAYGLLDGGTAYFLTRDHLGSIREVTDTTGTVQARFEYDPYGRMTRVGGTYTSVLGFTGHMVHEPSGLLFAPLRAYSAELGRWISEDPSGTTDGLNLYRYVLNDPVTRIDPTGEMSGDAICVTTFTVVGTYVGATIGAAAGAGATVGSAGIAAPAIPAGAVAGAAAGATVGAVAGFVGCVAIPYLICAAWKKLNDITQADDAAEPPAEGDCTEVVRVCAEKCRASGGWQGVGFRGTDAPMWMRRCTRACAKKRGCDNF